MLLAGVVLSSSPVDVAASAGTGSAGGGGVAVLEPATVATVPVVGRARIWGEVELGRGDQALRTPLLALMAALGLLPLVVGQWWLSRPDRRVASPQHAVTSAASRAPPVLV